MSLTTPYFAPPSSPDFEYYGIDVTWTVAQWGIHHQVRTRGGVDAHTSTWRIEEHRRIAVECKPLVGDDYPAILRFLKRLPPRHFHRPILVVLAGAVQSQTVPLAAIKQFFALSQVLLVLVDEVEAVMDAGRVCMAEEALPEAHSVYLNSPGKRCAACLAAEAYTTKSQAPSPASIAAHLARLDQGLAHA
jgi:hypothetical protein